MLHCHSAAISSQRQIQKTTTKKANKEEKVLKQSLGHKLNIWTQQFGFTTLHSDTNKSFLGFTGEIEE